MLTIGSNKSFIRQIKQPLNKIIQKKVHESVFASTVFAKFGPSGYCNVLTRENGYPAEKLTLNEVIIANNYFLDDLEVYFEK